MNYKCVVLLALVACAVALPEKYKKSKESKEDSSSKSYEFEYKVKEDSDELDFGHSEKKSGDKVEGYYYVLLPDARTKKVTYYVDGDSGFVADVSYEGDSKYDSDEKSSEYKKKKKKSY